MAQAFFVGPLNSFLKCTSELNLLILRKFKELYILTNSSLKRRSEIENSIHDNLVTSDEFVLPSNPTTATAQHQSFDWWNGSSTSLQDKLKTFVSPIKELFNESQSQNVAENFPSVEPAKPERKAVESKTAPSPVKEAPQCENKKSKVKKPVWSN